MEVHKVLGPGFLESVYDESLAREFLLEKISYERKKAIDVFYKEAKVKHFECDFTVESKVLVEIKAIKKITNIEQAQIINYLKASDLKVGLLINFGASSLEYKRFMN